MTLSFSESQLPLALLHVIIPLLYENVAGDSIYAVKI